MTAGFVHLRNHTAYSLAEGALRIPELAGLCRQFRMPACAITDTNNLFGAAEFSKYTIEAGVQPIIGTQIATDFGLPPETTERGKYSELILLAKDEAGYRNLIKLVSYAYIKKDAADMPHITLEWLGELSGGLIALTGGVSGVLGQCLAVGNAAMAEEKLLRLRD
ncbi:MAG: PHP domain-containing protein, partial [Rickettsiales bacterium]|nr:PHP domain-containing protein [Rickettsiales bacterium]